MLGVVAAVATAIVILTVYAAVVVRYYKRNEVVYVMRCFEMNAFAVVLK